MKSSEKKLLEDYIRFKENRENKYLVVDKKHIREEWFEYGTYTFKVVMPLGEAPAYYEFGGDTAVGKLMELYKQLCKEEKNANSEDRTENR